MVIHRVLSLPKRQKWSCFRAKGNEGDATTIAACSTKKRPFFVLILMKACAVCDFDKTVRTIAVKSGKPTPESPNAPTGIADGQYWEITPTGCTTGFTVDLTLPHTNGLSQANARACRYDTDTSSALTSTAPQR